MKKILAIFLALVLMFAFSTGALAKGKSDNAGRGNSGKSSAISDSNEINDEVETDEENDGEAEEDLDDEDENEDLDDEDENEDLDDEDENEDLDEDLDDEEEIIFKLHSPTKAVIVVPVKKKENEDLMMLLMPVRLNN